MDFATQASLLQHIQQNPYDGEVRQIYADLLEEHGLDDLAAEQRTWTPEKFGAEQWLRGFAQENNLKLEEVISKATAQLKTADFYYEVTSPTETHIFTGSPNFWRSYVRYTGHSVPEYLTMSPATPDADDYDDMGCPDC